MVSDLEAGQRDLDRLHEQDDDPWGVDSRWYEERKRALLLAALPRRRFRRGLEVGGSTGALAAALAERCDRLLVVDGSEHAVALARERLGPLDHVSVSHGSVPEHWPDGDLDLVVVSELGYFLSSDGLDGLVARVRASLTEDGVVVLCHWRHDVDGWPLDGSDVHDRFRAAGVRPLIAQYVDRDVELLVLGHESVAPDPGS